jgi:hypothetical protein
MGRYSMTKRTLTPAEEGGLSEQQARVYDVLKQGRGLSNLLAITNHGIGSLSSRVAELRKKFDLHITSEQRTDTTGKKYAVYSIPQEE